MATHASEDYLRIIFELEQECGRVATTALAEALQVSPASVTGMIKKLASQELVDHQRYQGVTLTSSGRQAALAILRRHRLTEQFLTEIIDVPWDRVHQEAHQIEHALSDYLLDRIDVLLNHPQTNPHGAPIPTRDGTLAPSTSTRLADLAAGATAIIDHVKDHDPALLRYLGQLGLLPGTTVMVIAIAPLNGPRNIQVGDTFHTLAREVAQQIWVVQQASRSSE